MTNAEFLTANKTDFFRLSCKKRTDEKGVFDILLDGRKFARIYASDNTSEMDALLAWLDMKHKEPILDDAEKRYLKGVIRPFRNQIISIYKEQFGFNHESIIIEYYDFDRSQSTLCLPQFEKGSMYAGMKTGWRYTLEDLGL